MMKPALLVLKSGVTLISYTDELDYEPKCHLYKPHTYKGSTKLTLTPWPELAEDQHILIHSNDLLTACEPNERLIKSYTTKVGKPPEETTSQPVVLTEEDISGDDYEPQFIEE